MPAFMKDGLYKFESFDDICNFAKTVDIRTIIDNALYSLNGTYYLKAEIMPVTSILEYATVVKYPALVEAKIAEHGNVLIKEDAIQTISKYFNKEKKARRARKNK